MTSITERIRAAFRPNVNLTFQIGADAPTQVLNYTARELYQSQDNLQAVVNFLSNSIAQLPLKVYRRDGETERIRDRDSVAAKLLYRPNADQTSFEFIRGIALEYFVFGVCYVWILPDDSESGFQLRILPSEWVISAPEATAYGPKTIRICTKNGGTAVDVPINEFIQFRTYSPGNPGGYISPVSALRQTLQEQIEAGRFRKQLWHSSGRLNAQIIRPKDVQPWDDETRRKFITAFREAWGPNGSRAGSIPLLEDGMEIKPFNASFRENQWAESVKLSREAVAAAYGINPALIWHTDAQTYASSKDNARALYAEGLGPILQMLQQRINAFLLPKIGAEPGTYVEFDIEEKLKGSFEERAAILQSAVGGPWLTINEARADRNLPPIEGGDALIVPLNVEIGGQASPQDTHSEPQEPAELVPVETTPAENAGAIQRKSEGEKRIKGKSEDEENEKVAELLSTFFKRQAKSILPKLNANPEEYWNADRWDKELADDIEPLINEIADKHGKDAAEILGSTYTGDATRKYLRKLSEGRARAINSITKKKLDKTAAEYDPEDENSIPPAHVFEIRENKDAGNLGRSLATITASWATIEAAHQAEQQPGFGGVIIEKEWVTGSNPRSSHAEMNGERVPIDANFSNGAFWPGDDILGPEETCNCNCSTEVVITSK